MSTLTVDLFSSLDGFASAENWPGYWGLEGPELFEHLKRDVAVDHIMLMGANTYRTMSTIVEQEEDPTFDRLAELPKVVFSSSLQPPFSWPNTRLIETDAIDAIREMKEQETKPLRTVGSITLNKALLHAGVVDRFRVLIFPVITGANGRDPIYADLPDIDLEMVSARTLDGRLQLLEYIPTLHR